tara:strand:- start:1006 stop:1818 length:813 start_codon:yes stop_codon:yes gene_type:complete
MQGRLSEPIENKIQSFPVNSWKSEFTKAENIGFELIEWIFDVRKNPIMDLDGIKEINDCLTNHNVGVNAVCADYFMEKLLFSVSSSELENNLKVLSNLIINCHKLEIEVLEIPLVDSSSLKNDSNKNEILKNLEPILKIAQDHNVLLTFETDLSPLSFKDFLQKFNHPSVMATYDTGNSTANEFNTKNELLILQKWIKNIHLKDRLKKGITVPLGTGDTDFELFVSIINDISYNGDFIIQGARNDLNSHIEDAEITCAKYLNFIKQYFDK